MLNWALSKILLQFKKIFYLEVYKHLFFYIIDRQVFIFFISLYEFTNYLFGLIWQLCSQTIILRTYNKIVLF